MADFTGAPSHRRQSNTKCLHVITVKALEGTQTDSCTLTVQSDKAIQTGSRVNYLSIYLTHRESEQYFKTSDHVKGTLATCTWHDMVLLG